MAENIVLAYGKNSATINPSLGGTLTSLDLIAHQNIRSIISPQNGYGFQSVWLFPFPNRMEKGKYSFEGKKYQFPINDDNGRPNALHGFVCDVAFQLKDQSASSCTVSYEYDGAFDYYPFPCSLTIRYSLDEDGLTCTATVENLGTTSMPCGLGWHPFFSAEKGVDNLQFKLPDTLHIELDELGIPTGLEKPNPFFNEFQNIQDTQLDDGFQIRKPEERNATFLKYSNGEIMELWQEKDYGFIQVYTHPDRKTIAIEPMTCGVNAFNTGKGLKILKAGELWQIQCGISLKEEKPKA